jgi:hypothetical protein
MDLRQRKVLGLGAVSDLFGGGDPAFSRAFQLFDEIAEARGQEEAETIFTTIVEFWKRKRKPKRGRGRPKGAPTVRLQDAHLLTIAQVMRSQNPKASDRQIARKYLFIIKGQKSPSTEVVSKTARALGRARRRAVSKIK